MMSMSLMMLATNQFFTWSQFNWVNTYNIFGNWELVIGYDAIGLSYIWLTAVIFPVAFLAIWGNIEKVRMLIILLNTIQLLLIGSFMAFDLLSFYIMFEGILIPMFLIIGIWGSRSEKVKASYYFFFYTLIGSVFFLIGILLLQAQTGSTSIFYLVFENGVVQKIIWIMFFIAFSVKIPMFPFHIWLPEAHVEAPTVGSVILAALLLKLGSFGYLRYMLPVFDTKISQFYWPLVVTLAGGSIVLASLTAIRQIDIKRIIAYSSIAHMNLAVLGLFANNYSAISGGLILTIAHGFVSAAMFLLIGVLYDRYHSRLVSHYSGLARVAPIFAIVFILFSLANLGFPLSYNFIGELSIIMGLIHENLLYGIIGLFGILISIVYTMWLANRILFGDISISYIIQFYDLHLREFLYFMPLFIPTVLFGVYPDYLEIVWYHDLHNLIR